MLCLLVFIVHFTELSGSVHTHFWYNVCTMQPPYRKPCSFSELNERRWARRGRWQRLRARRPRSRVWVWMGMHILWTGRRSGVKNHLRDRIRRGFVPNRNLAVRRTYVLTTMERAFETDYAYAHHFMNGYEGGARTTASQLAYRVMCTGFLQFECRRA